MAETTNTDSQKYDRQLRLWGEIAQARLEKHTFFVLELLKAIVLPGIGNITIADQTEVSQKDIETNFFIDVEDNGKKRGECCLRNLLELNDRVNGEFLDKSPNELLNNKDIQKYDIVCRSGNYKTNQSSSFEVITNGFYGLIKVYVDSHVIFDNGNKEIPMDLRIPEPFPKLQELATKFDLPKLSKDDHSHVPFPLILVWALKEWRNRNNSTGVPTTRQQKEEIKSIIKNEAHNFFAEENFGEAHQYAFYCWQQTPGSVKALITDKRATDSLENMTVEQVEFWGFIGAVKSFYDKNGRLPVDSTIKDMISSNTFFIELQEAFAHQLEDDAKELLEFVQKRTGSNVVSFTLEMMKRHCKALRKMQVIDGFNGSYETSWKESEYLFEETNSNLMVIALLFATLEFQEKYQRMPVGQNDKESLTQLTKSFLEKKGVSVEINQTLLDEVLRCGGVQIHTVNSVIGSFVGQELIKFSTHQFGALDNTFLFNTVDYTSLQGKF
ncbi:NEDD8-activating enzyme E1 regulatory subunit [Entamoeba marina]